MGENGDFCVNILMQFLNWSSQLCGKWDAIKNMHDLGSRTSSAVVLKAGERKSITVRPFFSCSNDAFEILS